MALLTPAQRKQLRFLRRFRDRPLTLGACYARNLRSYLVITVFFAALTAFTTYGDPYTTVIVATMYFTILVRDFGYFRRVVAGWPLSHEVMDWNRVDALLESDADGVEGERPERDDFR